MPELGHIKSSFSGHLHPFGLLYPTHPQYSWSCVICHTTMDFKHFRPLQTCYLTLALSYLFAFPILLVLCCGRQKCPY